jgi:serine/threonine-protein kinase RsbW
MCAADPPPSAIPDSNPGLAFAFPATVDAVREGLARALNAPCLADLTDEDRGTAELLLAEALNNVVEHAYARWPGEIRLSVAPRAGGLAVCICDQGLPMPGASPPKGELPAIDTFADLPEGGFGWFLIRSLSQQLTYQRHADCNELRFYIPVDNWEV